MSVAKSNIKSILLGPLPEAVVDNLLEEYLHIKQQFFLRKFQPAELNGARFSECVLRAIEYLNSGSYTPFGQQLNSERIITAAENNSQLKDTIRFFIPRLIRVLLDIRNKRDVAHVGGEVNPNFSDSLFVVHSTDWLLTEIIRHFHSCSIDEAKKIVENINEVSFPIVAEVNGFVRVQNSELSASDKILVILYYKNPEAVTDFNLLKWTCYKNSTLFKKILKKLHDKAIIHYASGACTLLPKGIRYVDVNIPLDIVL